MNANITPEVDGLLREAHVSVIGTVDPTGKPALAPVWHLWRDGVAYVLTSRNSRKWRNIQRNPRVSLCVDTKESPYRAAIVEGPADEAALDYHTLLRELAIHYLGETRGNAYADNSTSTPEDSVVLRIVPERVISWAY
ncbi:MAG: TIGR03618 family F420-dependent PPOX class oxidoreductase [Dehalococcoidia bacterium]